MVEKNKKKLEAKRQRSQVGLSMNLGTRTMEPNFKAKRRSEKMKLDREIKTIFN